MPEIWNSALYHRNSKQAELNFRHPEKDKYHQQKYQMYFNNIVQAPNYIYDHDKYKAAVQRGDKTIVYKNKKYKEQAKRRGRKAALRRLDRLFNMIEKERLEKEKVMNKGQDLGSYDRLPGCFCNI